MPYPGMPFNPELQNLANGMASGDYSGMPGWPSYPGLPTPGMVSFFNEQKNPKINKSSDIYCARRDRRGALKFSLRPMPISSVVYQAVCHPISSNRNHVTQPKRNLRHAFQAKSKSMKKIYRLKNEKNGKKNAGKSYLDKNFSII